MVGNTIYIKEMSFTQRNLFEQIKSDIINIFKVKAYFTENLLLSYLNHFVIQYIRIFFSWHCKMFFYGRQEVDLEHVTLPPPSKYYSQDTL